MAKEDFFSKLNIKDYNNQLEKILEEKSFSEGTKNILLNILYKMETSYDDYKKVKVYTKLKKELLEETIKIIKENCNKIEIVKPKLNEKTKLENKKYIIEEDKIISYPNEKNLFYALNHLNSNRFILSGKYDILKEPMEKLLNIGYITDRNEIIRDFDGWTWNIISDDIENYIYNIMYQNIKILIGNEVLQKCIDNKTVNFINEFENALNTIYDDEEKKNEISKLIYQVSILENIKNNEFKKDEILNIKEKLKKELFEMNNKKQYLQKIASCKKIIGKEIKEIDEKINNNKLLRESFIHENKNLKESNRIFSLSEYSERLQEKRENLLKQLNNYSDLMKPMNFVKKKTEISDKYNLLNEINFDISIDEEILRLLINVQKVFLTLFSKKIINIQSKKEIMEFIYLFRYYKLIYINCEKQVIDIEELSEELRKTEKMLITKACKLKAINILCQNIEKNYQLVSKILSYNIIDLEDVKLEFSKHDKNIVFTIYDDESVEDTIIYDANEELNVKFNKRIRLFN